MITMFLLTGLALLTIAAGIRVGRGAARAVSNPDELLVALHALDLQAFRNLIDPSEEQYLRQTLSRQEFRRVQRLRLRAIADYVSRVAFNASLLMRLGSSARHHADPEVASVAEQLLADAFQLRLNAVLALVVLRMRMLAPGARLKMPALLRSYDRSREHMLRFTRLQAPSVVSRLEASL